MTQAIIQAAFQTPDGKVFTNKADAEAHVRKPLVKAALLAITAKNVDLADWLLENKDEILGSYVADKLRRVSKAERKQLAVELAKAVAAIELPFITANLDGIVDSFKFPTVERIKPEEKEAAITKAFETLTLDETTGEVNTDLVKWLLANKEALVAAYETGIEKRAVSEKAVSALAEYQAAKAKAKAEGPEALERFKKERAEMAKAKADAEKAAKASKV